MLPAVKYLLASALVATTVDGHGYMSDPLAKFLTTNDPSQFVATIDSSTVGFDGKFDGTPVDNSAAFTKAFAAGQYSSLKDLVFEKATVTVPGATLECGSCDPKAPALPLPETNVVWSGSDTVGFTPSHVGPCEVWCDDVRTFQDDDCPAHFTMVPAALPYDRDACMGSSTLTFYWLAMHSSTWQVYVSCAPLEASASTGATSKFAVGDSSTQASNSTEAPSIAPIVEATTAPPILSTTTAPPTIPAPETTIAPIDTSSPSSAGGSSATSASDCGSLSVAEPESDAGSLEAAEPQSDCGSLSVAEPESVGASGSTNDSPDSGSNVNQAPLTSSAGSMRSFDFNTLQGKTNVATVSPYV